MRVLTVFEAVPSGLITASRCGAQNLDRPRRARGHAFSSLLPPVFELVLASIRINTKFTGMAPRLQSPQERVYLIQKKLI